MARTLLAMAPTWTAVGWLHRQAPALPDADGVVRFTDTGQPVYPGAALLVPVTSAANGPGYVTGYVLPDGRLHVPPLGRGTVVDLDPVPCPCSGVLCDTCAAVEVPAL